VEGEGVVILRIRNEVIHDFYKYLHFGIYFLRFIGHGRSE